MPDNDLVVSFAVIGFSVKMHGLLWFRYWLSANVRCSLNVDALALVYNIMASGDRNGVL